MFVTVVQASTANGDDYVFYIDTIDKRYNKTTIQQLQQTKTTSIKDDEKENTRINQTKYMKIKNHFRMPSLNSLLLYMY